MCAVTIYYNFSKRRNIEENPLQQENNVEKCFNTTANGTSVNARVTICPSKEYWEQAVGTPICTAPNQAPLQVPRP